MTRHGQRLLLTSALLSATACSATSEMSTGEELVEHDSTSDVSEQDMLAPYAPPVELEREAFPELWANLFGGFERAAQVELSEGERNAITTALEADGFLREQISFVGANLFIDDMSFNAESALARLRSETVEKGKVLNQIVTDIFGRTSLVSSRDVQAAPARYASQDENEEFLFDRPEVESPFLRVIVLADNTPQRIVTAFRDAVAEIGNASDLDCLGSDFLRVMTRSEFDDSFGNRPFDVPPRVTEVAYGPGICGASASGCAQFPRIENVALAPASPFPGGGGGVSQRRFLFGGFIGIDSNQVTPTSAEFSTITHELMHAIGIAHPQQDEFPSGTTAAKLVVPDTESADSGYRSIMALRRVGGAANPDRVFNLSADDIDTIRTLYSSAPGCSYQRESIAISGI